jgi:hypothetical protein
LCRPHTNDISEVADTDEFRKVERTGSRRLELLLSGLLFLLALTFVAATAAVVFWVKFFVLNITSSFVATFPPFGLLPTLSFCLVCLLKFLQS